MSAQPEPHPLHARAPCARALVRSALVLWLATTLASCVTMAVNMTEHRRRGRLDWDARVQAAWLTSGGDLALELRELEGSWRRHRAFLLLPASEVEASFAPPPTDRTKPAAHVLLPRARLLETMPERPDPASVEIPAIRWDPRAPEHPPPPADARGDPAAPFAVIWTNSSGVTEGSLTLILTRRRPASAAVFVLAHHATPYWIDLVQHLPAIAADVFLIALALG